jgi:hypothetical protein
MQGKGAAPGTVMLAIYRAMCATVQSPLFKPIQLEVDMEAGRAKLSVPGVVETALEPIKNPVTGAVRVAVIAAFVLLAKISFPGTRGGRWISGAGLLVSAALVVSL